MNGSENEVADQFSILITRSQGTQTNAIAPPSSPFRWTRAKANAADSGTAPPYSLPHRRNLPSVRKLGLRNSADILVLVPQRTQRITESAFQISFHPDWQIDNGFFKRPIMARTSIPGTQVEAQNKDFSAVSQTDLTRV